jgi:serine/threonine protein kinase
MQEEKSDNVVALAGWVMIMLCGDPPARERLCIIMVASAPVDITWHPDWTIDKNEGRLRSSWPVMGSLVGGYLELDRKLGRGGGGAVFLVRHAISGEQRAVKLLEEYASRQRKERFFMEGRIMATLHHEGIPEVYGVGTSGKYAYIEMEYAEGRSVEELLARHGKMSVPVVMHIAEKICDALEYAYRRKILIDGRMYGGFVHCDIKPANVMVRRSGGVKLIDFGIARLKGRGDAQIGAGRMGTLAYASPEQLSGCPVDHRSDIYSLGAMMYEMLTGQKAFPQNALKDVRKAKTKGQYKKLAEFRGIPGQLQRLVDWCVQADVDRRPGSATVVKTWLKNIMEENVYPFSVWGGREKPCKMRGRGFFKCA